MMVLFSLRDKCPIWNTLLILQGENKTFQTFIRLSAVVFISGLPVPNPEFPFHRSETAENVLVWVQNQSQNGSVTVTSSKIAEAKTRETPKSQAELLSEMEKADDSPLLAISEWKLLFPVKKPSSKVVEQSVRTTAPSFMFSKAKSLSKVLAVRSYSRGTKILS
jgi:hypothetical protein